MRWQGGLEIEQAKRLKELEKENARLKKLVADQALDNAMLKDVAAGKLMYSLAALTRTVKLGW